MPRNGHSGGIRRYAEVGESASTAVNSVSIDPDFWPGRSGLVAGELAHMCGPVSKVLHHGTIFRRPENSSQSWLIPWPMGVRSLSTLG
jgi:hypothetical protein